MASSTWRRASACASNSCVEVALGRVLRDSDDLDHVMVRDSKLGDRSPVLRFDRPEWAAFLDGVRAGEFDAG